MLHTADVRSGKACLSRRHTAPRAALLATSSARRSCFGLDGRWTLFGSRLYAEFLVLFVLAYIFGIAFQYLPIRAMRRISRREALIEAIKADTLALTAFEIGLFAWMAFMYFHFVPRSELTSPTYWFMMQIGMVLGFIASFPINSYLVRVGVKPGM
jgi:Domain of unknown function (DUF4396)